MGWIEDVHGAVLLIRQKRGKKLWSLPGGKIEGAESLEQGLIREIREETSLDVKFARFVGIFDRPDKANLTMLYRVHVRAGGHPVPQPSEISEIGFRNSLPMESTPSLQYFWRVMHSANQGIR